MKQYFEKHLNNQLIHFTGSLDNIISILQSENLKLGYCKEEFSISYRSVVSKSVHPIVCFSEQDETQLSNAEITYGKYGIAFQPTWIVANNIQPVMYIEQNSQVAYSLAKLLLQRRSMKKGSGLRLPIMTLKCFVKNTIGYNSYFNIEDFLFKQENEWRFVPNKNQIGSGYISESRSVFLSNEKIYNDKLERHPLRFKINSDVLCVYYEHDNDRQILIDRFAIPDQKIKKANWRLVQRK